MVGSDNSCQCHVATQSSIAFTQNAGKWNSGMFLRLRTYHYPDYSFTQFGTDYTLPLYSNGLAFCSKIFEYQLNSNLSVRFVGHFFLSLEISWIVPEYEVGCGSLCLGVIWSNLCLRYCAVVRNFWRVVERRKPTRLSEDGLRNSQYFSDNHEIFAWIVQNVCQLLWTISSLTGTALKAYFHRSKDRVWIENIHFMFRTQNSNLFGKFFTKVYGNWFSYVVRRVRDSSHERIDHDSGLVYSEIFIKWNIREKSSVRYDTFVSRTRSRARRSNTQWKKQWFP